MEEHYLKNFVISRILLNLDYYKRSSVKDLTADLRTPEWGNCSVLYKNCEEYQRLKYRRDNNIPIPDKGTISYSSMLFIGPNDFNEYVRKIIRDLNVRDGYLLKTYCGNSLKYELNYNYGEVLTKLSEAKKLRDDALGKMNTVNEQQESKINPESIVRSPCVPFVIPSQSVNVWAAPESQNLDQSAAVVTKTASEIPKTPNFSKIVCMQPFPSFGSQTLDQTLDQTLNQPLDQPLDQSSSTTDLPPMSQMELFFSRRPTKRPLEKDQETEKDQEPANKKVRGNPPQN